MSLGPNLQDRADVVDAARRWGAAAVAAVAAGRGGGQGQGAPAAGGGRAAAQRRRRPGPFPVDPAQGVKVAPPAVPPPRARLHRQPRGSSRSSRWWPSPMR